MENIEHLRFPIGRFKDLEFTVENKLHAIRIIEEFPEKITNEIKDLQSEELEIPYRPGGWNIRQTIHHCSDSHLNAYIRFKLALTEDSPVIKPYLQDAWVRTSDAKLHPQISLDLLDLIHQKWVVLLKGMHQKDFERSFIHPERKGKIKLATNLFLYSWHCEHHLAHVKLISTRNIG